MTTAKAMNSQLVGRVNLTILVVVLAVFTISGWLAGCSPSSETVDSPSDYQIDVPTEAIEYAEAINNRDLSGVAKHFWFPGALYPEIDTVEPKDVPQLCIEAELDHFIDREIDIDSIHATHHSLNKSGVLPGISIVGEYDMVWLPAVDSEDGREFAERAGRIVISPWLDDDCWDEAIKEYGEPGE
ncbi:MAG: hypothetical protein FWG16_05425 [Micrococcales bacterium]|nr:hypothetical protein [Micrococcales bacterium]